MLEYGKKFYKDYIRKNFKSAEIIVPMVLDILSDTINIKEFSVLDLGCGTGHWLKEYKTRGAKEVLGIDRTGHDDLLEIDVCEFCASDLNKSITLNKKYDLAQCLEVAEHIESQNAKVVVSNLVNASDIILFSAAIPYQRGAHHVNEQWPTYWIELFGKENYVVIDCIREKIWNHPEVRGFYAQNIFLFCRRTEKNKKLVELSQANRPEMFNLVHPSVWEELNSYKFMKFIDKLRSNRFIYWIYATFIKK